MFAVLLTLFLQTASTDSLVVLNSEAKLVYTGTFTVHNPKAVSNFLSSKRINTSQIAYFHQISNTQRWEWVVDQKAIWTDSVITGIMVLSKKRIGVRVHSIWHITDYAGVLYSDQLYTDLEMQGTLLLGRKSGTILLTDKQFSNKRAFRYEWAQLYPDQMLVFQQSRTFGVLQLNNGTLVLKPEYEQIARMPSGNFLCKKGQKFGVMSDKGAELVPFIFDQIVADSAGYMYTSKFDIKIIHDNLRQLKLIDETVGVYGAQGKLILPVEYSKIAPIQKGHFTVWKNEQVGLYNAEGKQILPFKYANLGTYQHGLCPAGKGVYKGIIDAQGAWFVKPDYAEIIQMNDSVWICKRPETDVLFYPKLRKFGLEYYEELKPLELGYIRTLQEGSYGLLKPSGKPVLKPEWTSIRVHVKEQIIVAAKVYYYSIFYLNGNLKVYMNYPLTKFDWYSNGMAMVVHHDKYGFIDKDGALLVSTQYDGARPFKNGLAAVQIGFKWGLIDRFEKIILSPNYDEIFDFNGSTAAVRRNKLWGIIDKAGKEVLKPQYTEITRAPYNMYYVRSATKIGLVSMEGAEVINPVYRDCEVLTPEVVKIRPYTKYGLVSATNKPLSAMEYDNIWYDQSSQTFVFYKRADWEVIR